MVSDQLRSGKIPSEMIGVIGGGGCLRLGDSCETAQCDFRGYGCKPRTSVINMVVNPV